MHEINIVIISGLSGSGKSTALKTIEDLGFYCIDNLPIILLPKFIELCRSSQYDISKIALVVDVREGSFLKELKPTLNRLKSEGFNIEMIFLECSNDILIQRFSETRRNHPLSEDGSVREGILLEREMLKDIRKLSDRQVDTTDMNVHQLRGFFQECFDRFSRQDMVITFMSFGFRYGVPHDSDNIFDVRFLPNPYFVNELKELDGNDERILRYVFSRSEANDFFDKLTSFLSFLIPLFKREGKSYLTVATGCTGGRHRSVVVANQLKKFYEQMYGRVSVIHRDIDKK
jgi:UPF0042 nucleotide-binding protein